jgi:hypothetical protein
MVTAKPDEMKLDELKRLLRRLDQTMQASPLAVKDVHGIAPLIPTGREFIVPAQPADALAGVRGQGRSSTSGRTIVLAAGISAAVSVAACALVFGGITTPQRTISATAHTKEGARPAAGMTTASTVQALTQSEQVQQPALDELKRPAPLLAESVHPVVEATPPIETRTNMALPLPKPANNEPAGTPSQTSTPADPKETAALKGAGNGPASNSNDGPALAELDSSQLLRRGLNMLSGGNVSAAQLLLERAADLGSGDAAFALATTYDGALGSPRSGSAVRPNVDLALRWYERAAVLEVEGAQKRLAELKKASSPGG